jgi:hypothetical protein
MSVVQPSTLKTAKEFEFGSLSNLDMILSALRTIEPTSSDSGNLKTIIRSRMKFRVLNALVFCKIINQYNGF